jgi:integrase
MAKFTDRYIQSLKPQDRDYRVREGHGYALRVLPSGIKRFEFIYNSPTDGRRRIMHLGNYPSVTLSEARQRYLDAASLLAKKIDPQSPPPTQLLVMTDPEILTVSGLKSRYVEHIKTHLVDRSVKHQDNRLEMHLIPVWSERHIKDVRRRDAIELIEKIAAKKPGAARNVLLAARAMFTYALRRELVEYNPFSEVGLAVPAATANERDRTLSDDELKNAVLPYLLSPGGNTIAKNALFLILVTGQRPGEVAGMHKDEINENWWTIPWQRLKTECRKGKKNPQDHRVYLTPLAKSMVLPSDGHIFPASRRAEGPIRTNTLSHHVQHQNPNYLGLPRWTPHDLRRTARTGMAALNVPERHAEAVLNHALEGVKSIYDRHHYDKEKKAALTKWSKHLEKLIKEISTQN